MRDWLGGLSYGRSEGIRVWAAFWLGGDGGEGGLELGFVYKRSMDTRYGIPNRFTDDKKTGV